jgi:hypothetical protein
VWWKSLCWPRGKAAARHSSRFRKAAIAAGTRAQSRSGEEKKYQTTISRHAQEAHPNMTRHAALIIPLLFIAALAACTELAPEAADGPLAPEAQMSQAEAGSAATPGLGVSTTCQSFRKELDAINEQLSANATDTDRQHKQAALTAIVADVCN